MPQVPGMRSSSFSRSRPITSFLRLYPQPPCPASEVLVGGQHTLQQPWPARVRSTSTLGQGAGLQELRRASGLDDTQARGQEPGQPPCQAAPGQSWPSAPRHSECPGTGIPSSNPGSSGDRAVAQVGEVEEGGPAWPWSALESLSGQQPGKLYEEALERAPRLRHGGSADACPSAQALSGTPGGSREGCVPRQHSCALYCHRGGPQESWGAKKAQGQGQRLGASCSLLRGGGFLREEGGWAQSLSRWPPLTPLCPALVGLFVSCDAIS